LQPNSRRSEHNRSTTAETTERVLQLASAMGGNGRSSHREGTYAYADCAARYLGGQIPTQPAHVYTSSGFVTGTTFGSACHPVGS
jgi:hypothetical protein